MNFSAPVITLLHLDEGEEQRARKLSCHFNILICLSCEQFFEEFTVLSLFHSYILHMCLFFQKVFFRWVVIFKSFTDCLASYFFCIIIVSVMCALLMRFSLLFSYYPPSRASSPTYPWQILFTLSFTRREDQGKAVRPFCLQLVRFPYFVVLKSYFRHYSLQHSLSTSLDIHVPLSCHAEASCYGDNLLVSPSVPDVSTSLFMLLSLQAVTPCFLQVVASMSVRCNALIFDGSLRSQHILPQL